MASRSPSACLTHCMASTTPDLSTWSPLKQPIFRSLWLASAVSMIGTGMHDVGAAWLMTSLAPTSPFLVALMQAASSLPFFLLALPAGAIADVIDRRKMLLVTQTWMLLAAVVLGLLTIMGVTTPGLLLGLTFALSIGSAMNMPVWQAIIPELVAKSELSAASTLSGIVINLSRLIGPAIAGLVIAGFGTGAVFLLNALSFVGTIVVLYVWKRSPIHSGLPAERFLGALQAGIRYARFAPPLQTVFIRTSAYIFFASGLFALLPLLGRRELGLDALGYGIILGFWGIGGLAGAFIIPKVREHLSIDRIVAAGSALLGLSLLVLALVRSYPIVCCMMILVGISSLGVMVSLNVSAQTSVPAWIRARALATHMLIFQGCLALGSLVWGTIAQATNLTTAMAMAGGGLLLGIPLVRPYRLRCAEKLDLSASLHWREPHHEFEPSLEDGPILITLEYYIDPTQAAEFRKAMRSLERMRRRDGAIRWGLFQDLSEPSRFLETMLVESWAEHRRQFERVTNADRAIEEQVRAFHMGVEPPRVSQMIYRNDG